MMPSSSSRVPVNRTAPDRSLPPAAASLTSIPFASSSCLATIDRRSIGDVTGVLRQVVVDGVPGRLGADENVLGGSDAGRIAKRTERDMHLLAHHGVEVGT